MDRDTPRASPVEETVNSEAQCVPSAEALSVLLYRHIATQIGHRVRDLRVTPLDGRLFVQGHVPTYYLKQLVLAAAMEFLARCDMKADLAVEVILLADARN